MDGHTLAFQKNNLVDSIVITVDTDETWQYKLDVKYPCKDSKGEELYNVIDVPRVGNICTAIMQAPMLPFSGKYTMQLRGISGDKVYHTDTFDVWVKYSIDPSKVYNPVPSEFYQIEQAVTEQAANAKQSEIESAESARQSSESAVNAQKYAEDAAESANEAHKSREAIENMEVSAVSLSPDSAATVEKSIVDDKVKLTFGIPKGEKGESDIFWINAIISINEDGDEEEAVDRTADEIISAYKSGKTMCLRATQQDDDGISYQSDFSSSLVRYAEDLDGNRGMLLFFSKTKAGLDGDLAASGALITIQNDKVSLLAGGSASVGILTDNLPVESKLNGAARENEYGLDTYAAYYDHVHPAPFPNWTNSIGKALFVNNDNTTPSQAFEWRDVPNGDFTSKVGDFLRVAEVNPNGKPTKWTTDGSNDPVVIKSSTPNSNKKFRITVDDAGTISATEV
jgi:hypothetical protein